MHIHNQDPNQVVITLKDYCQIFTSYGVPVAAFIPGEGYYTTVQKYSASTTRHINAFTGGMGSIDKPQKYFDELLQNA